MTGGGGQVTFRMQAAGHHQRGRVAKHEECVPRKEGCVLKKEGFVLRKASCPGGGCGLDGIVAVPAAGYIPESRLNIQTGRAQHKLVDAPVLI